SPTCAGASCSVITRIPRHSRTELTSSIDNTNCTPSEPCSLDEDRMAPMQSRQPAGAAVLRPEKTEAIIAAFFAELGQNGYPGLTMDRVAERAGVGKAALYRRWPSKQHLLIDSVGRYATRAVLPPDTGSLAG